VTTLRLLPPRVQGALAVVALLVVAALGYFLLIAPKRSAAAELETEIGETQAQIDARRAQARVRPMPALDVADVFRATRALPDDDGIPEVILELNRLAGDSGLSFESIAPGPPVEVGGNRAVPITLVAEGSYFGVSSFLARVRNLVRVERGRLKASGRLFAVDSISFTEATDEFPKIRATLRINALSYGGAAASSSTANGEADSPASTTTTEADEAS
jgi:Tfp pilus assembly protein PilO